MAKIHYREQDMQIRCVKYFRVTYPHFACLLFHPKNEEAGGRTRAVIAKAEGVQAGVADLMLLVPTPDYIGLAIEMKDKRGRQSEKQKIFQRYFEAVGGKYIIPRSYEEFVTEIEKYMEEVTPIVWGDAKRVFREIDDERTLQAKRELEKMLGKK